MGLLTTKMVPDERVMSLVKYTILEVLIMRYNHTWLILGASTIIVQQPVA